MTRYHLYIMCGSAIDADTRFYKVGIGESERQSRLRVFLESYAIEHGHFFSLMDNDAFEFMVKCLDSVNGTLSQVTTIDGESFVRQLREGAPVPYSLNANMQRHDLLKRIDSAYYSMCQLRKRRK